jgi:hypothetical protein
MRSPHPHLASAGVLAVGLGAAGLDPVATRDDPRPRTPTRDEWHEWRESRGWRDLLARAILLCVCVLAGQWGGGCAYRVTPPATVESAATVTLLDFGKHSGLVLPREDGTRTRYAFGEWEWFALGRDNPLRAINLLAPQVGTLERLDIPRDDPTDMTHQAEASWDIVVERSRVDALLTELDGAFERGAQVRVIDDPATGRRFVPVDYDEYLYLLVGNNCNDATARWLRAVGCRVSGSSVSARFVVEKPRDGGVAHVAHVDE